MSNLTRAAGIAPPVTISNVASTEAYHYTGSGDCARTIGPRGGRHNDVVTVRASGQVQTWKTRPGAFRRPIKYGPYDSGAITEQNGGDFHRAEDCPLGEL